MKAMIWHVAEESDQQIWKFYLYENVTFILTFYILLVC